MSDAPAADGPANGASAAPVAPVSPRPVAAVAGSAAAAGDGQQAAPRAASPALPPVLFDHPPLPGRVLKVGLLSKLSGTLHSVWRTRLCALTERGELHYLRPNEGATDEQLAGPQQPAVVHVGKQEKGQINCREAVTRFLDASEAAAAGAPAHSWSIRPASGGKRFLLAAKTLADRDAWVAAIGAFGDAPDQRPVQAPNAKARELLFGQRQTRASPPSDGESLSPRGGAGGDHTHRSASPHSPAGSDSSSTSSVGGGGGGGGPLSPRGGHRSSGTSGSGSGSGSLAAKPLATLGVTQATVDLFRGSDKAFQTLGGFATAGEQHRKSHTHSGGGSILSPRGDSHASSASSSSSSSHHAPLSPRTTLDSILSARAALELPLPPPSVSPALGTLQCMGPPNGHGQRIYFCGWLLKLGRGTGMLPALWQRRWFVLSHAGQLAYWSSDSDMVARADSNAAKPKDQLDVSRCVTRIVGEQEAQGAGQPFAFTMHPPARAGGRVYSFAAESAVERQMWMSALSHFGPDGAKSASPPPAQQQAAAAPLALERSHSKGASQPQAAAAASTAPAAAGTTPIAATGGQTDGGAPWSPRKSVTMHLGSAMRNMSLNSEGGNEATSSSPKPQSSVAPSSPGFTAPAAVETPTAASVASETSASAVASSSSSSSSSEPKHALPDVARMDASGRPLPPSSSSWLHYGSLYSSAGFGSVGGLRWALLTSEALHLFESDRAERPMISLSLRDQGTTAAEEPATDAAAAALPTAGEAEDDTLQQNLRQEFNNGLVLRLPTAAAAAVCSSPNASSSAAAAAVEGASSPSELPTSVHLFARSEAERDLWLSRLHQALQVQSARRDLEDAQAAQKRLQQAAQEQASP